MADFAKEQLRLYELRQYPVLGAGATHFFETSKIDPSIPETVFTTNITFLLSRENKAGSKKTKIPPIPKENTWTARLEKQKKTSRRRSAIINRIRTVLSCSYGLRNSTVWNDFENGVCDTWPGRSGK